MGFIGGAVGTIVGYGLGFILIFGGLFAMAGNAALGGIMIVLGLVLVLWGERSRRAALSPGF
ncbi:hypothetical protein [Halorarum salinum]|uniref:Uncharacterized protein n=1 Tax=Halorarum salinum TaxID=2743089 RepID=A0A7D5QLY0_9EURY|nr:hypothetical protein [Halobaculum salinum]QLG63065.1 hypothetical protein HUG12_15525 [Halobaculum salinum]